MNVLVKKFFPTPCYFSISSENIKHSTFVTHPKFLFCLHTLKRLKLNTVKLRL